MDIYSTLVRLKYFAPRFRQTTTAAKGTLRHVDEF
jgi:hypothetical protein